MAAMRLQQALKSLCSKNGWCYAVFWKLKRHSQMMLTWEEGYYYNSRKEDPSEVASGSEGILLDQRGHSDSEGQMALAIAKMSYCVFSVGEGIIGRVAFTGKHKWVFHNMDVAPERILDNQDMFEKYPEGWQGQFAAGIKTIAVIAVTQGVIQLGSRKLIKEDSGWLDHIKSVFATLQATPSATRSHRLSGGQGEQLTHSAVSCTGDISSTSSNVIDHSIDSSRMIGIVNSVGTCEQKTKEIQCKPFSTCTSTYSDPAEKSLQNNLGPKESANPILAVDEFTAICGSINDHVKSKCFRLTTDNDGILKPLNFSHQINAGTSELETFLASFAKEQSSHWGIGDELSQALGLTFKKEINDQPPPLQRSEINRENSLQSAYVKHDKITQNWPSSAINAEHPENKSELLLDAVVRNSSSGYQSASLPLADKIFPAKTSCSSLSTALPSMITIKETEIKTSRPMSPLSTLKLQDVIHEHTLYSDLDDVKTSPEHQLLSVSNVSPRKNSFACEGRSLRSDDTLDSYLRKAEDRGSKKRSRSGDSSRPRPKDRQQIQDRVRELRDIVPSASKCSIDTLLEKTIKHMLFLQSVVLHAEQLKIDGELKEDIKSGASWALDQENKNPILVKDLKQPRHMLVEMIFEEKGLFLEIVDIIRSLGLTILKGIMEAHGDKVWAKFVVQASKDVQRVDVLMQLVQQLPLSKKRNTMPMPKASQAVPK